MSLIEQLGGYEYLNEFYKRAVAHGFTLTEIKEELLKYRRQHNIFEVGDLIVYLSNIAPEHNDIYNVWKVDLIGCLVMLGDMDYRAMYGQIRHATDEEIKAGKRLEVNQ